MRTNALLICLLFLSVSLSVYAQRKNRVDPSDVLTEYQSSLPTEKVFLHLNKTEFGQGEIIWIKSYLVAGPMHLPSPLSKTLYIELLNETGNILKRLSLRSEEGIGQASIEIGKDWPQGIYYLRAYTNWMKNQDETYFFKKKIDIISTDLAESSIITKVKQPLSLRFFPEGGSLVQNIQSWLAYEIAGPDSTHNLSGKIFNSNDEEIQQFQATHDGRGRIKFLPDASSYYAIIDGTTQRWPLPKALSKGSVMSVNNSEKDQVIVTLVTTDPDLYIVHAHTRGISTYQTQLRIGKQKSRLFIPKSDIPEGITTLTLFDKQRRPVAERLIFINHNKGLNVKVTPRKSVYGRRELAQFDVTVLDDLDQPVQGSFSLTALNNQVSKNDQPGYNIRANQLITSDLNGYIENPSQYLEDSKSARTNSDLLMMVNGWRRFKWDEILLQDTIRPNYLVEQGLKVKGRIYREGKDLVKGGQVFMFTNLDPDASKDLSMTNENGEFEFNNKVFTDTTLITIQSFFKRGKKKLNLALDSVSFEPVPWKPYYQKNPFTQPEEIQKFKEYMITTITVDTTFRREGRVLNLGDVVVEARDGREAELNKQLGRQMNTIFMADIPYEEKKGRDTYAMMIGRVGGFYFGAGGGGSSAYGSDIEVRVPMMGMGIRWASPPITYIDGQQVEYQDLYGLEATRIKTISSSRAAPPGEIRVTTFSRKEYYSSIPKGPSYYSGTLPGYHVPREYYKPIYDGREQAFKPDNRATFHWEPMISTDENGKAIVEFYTSDDVTEVQIDIQGIGVNGKSGVGSAKIAIEKNP